MTEALNRKLWIVLCVLLALVSLVRGWDLLSQRQTHTSISGFSLARIADEDINAFTVEEGSRTLEFRHDPQTGWFVDGKKADDERLASLFETFAGTEVQALVSRNSENHADFGLTETEGMTLTLSKRDQEEERFVIGDRGRSGQTFYVKRSGSDSAYLASSDLRGKLGEHADFWRDKRIAHIERSQVQSIEIIRPDDITTLKPTDGGWMLETETSSQEASEERIGQFFTSISPLKAVSFADEEQMNAFTETDEKITLRIQTSGETEEFIIASIDGSWWLQPKGSEEVFEIQALTARNLFLDDADE